jgi:hypothetical protein
MEQIILRKYLYILHLYNKGRKMKEETVQLPSFGEMLLLLL